MTLFQAERLDRVDVLLPSTAKPGLAPMPALAKTTSRPPCGDDPVDQPSAPGRHRDVDDLAADLAPALGEHARGLLEEVSVDVGQRHARAAVRQHSAIAKPSSARGARHDRAHVAHVEQAAQHLG